MTASTRPLERWRKPPFGWVKLNVDGAWKEEEGTGGVGMILRDHVGAIIYSSCRFIQRCMSALEAEMATLMDGVTLALEQSPNRLIAETGCSTVARMNNDSEANRSLVVAMVGDIRQLIAGR